MPWVWGPRGHRGGVGGLPDRRPVWGFGFCWILCDLEQETCLEKKKKKNCLGEFLVIQWLGLHSTGGGTGSILAQVTKIPQATRCGQITKTKLSRLQYQVADIAYLPG